MERSTWYHWASATWYENDELIFDSESNIRASSGRKYLYEELFSSNALWKKAKDERGKANFFCVFDKEVRLFAFASGEKFSVSSLTLLIRFDLDCNVSLANFPQQMQTMMLCRDYAGGSEMQHSILQTNSICGRVETILDIMDCIENETWFFQVHDELKIEW